MRWLVLVLCLCAAGASAQDFNTDVHTVPAPQNAARAEANAALEARDYEKALRLLGTASGGEPEGCTAAVRPWVGAGRAGSRRSAAVTSYRAAIENDGLFLEPRVALGLLLARGGKLAEARAEFVGAVGGAERKQCCCGRGRTGRWQGSMRRRDRRTRGMSCWRR